MQNVANPNNVAMNSFPCSPAKKQRIDTLPVSTGHHTVGTLGRTVGTTVAATAPSNLSFTPSASNIPPPLASSTFAPSAYNVAHSVSAVAPSRTGVAGATGVTASRITTMPNQREWRQSRQSAKFKMAMEILDQFKQNHGGKLPSLRAVMKMLKVGFPKAHEILDAYAQHCGVTVCLIAIW